MHARRHWGWAAALVALLGCSDDADGNTATTGTGGSGGDGTQSFFECLPFDETDPPPEEDAVDYTIQIRNQQQQPIEGLLLQACERADRSCDTPVRQDTSTVDGIVTLAGLPTPMPIGFTGYLQVAEAAEHPNLLFPNPPVSEPPIEGQFWFIENLTELGLLATAVGVSLDAGRGHVLFSVKNCISRDSAGVTVSVDTGDAKSTTAYLLEGFQPSVDASATAEPGVGGVFNVLAGDAVVTATVQATGQHLQSYRLFVRAGSMSHVTLRPYADLNL